MEEIEELKNVLETFEIENLEDLKRRLLEHKTIKRTLVKRLGEDRYTVVINNVINTHKYEDEQITELKGETQ